MQLNSFENRVFDVRLESGNHLIVKFYRPGRWSRKEIEEEHSFLFELAEDEIPVCAPLQFAGQSLGERSGILFALWERTGGRAPEELTTVDRTMLGRFLGRLHTTGGQRSFQHRRELSAATYVQTALTYIDPFLPPHLRKRYTDLAQHLGRVFSSQIQKVPLLRIHGDFHRGNLLSSGQGYFCLDFDDSLTGPAIQDFWMLLPPPEDQEFQSQLNDFIEGYEEFRHFDPGWLKLIETLRALRYIHYSGWIARRWEDPAFPAAFGHFGSDSYWEEATLDLEEQCERIENLKAATNLFHE